MIRSESRKRPTGPLPASATSLEDCPLDRKELGRATWGLLHTTAANYPENPRDYQKTAAKELINGLAITYPCKDCAADFRQEIAKNPPKVGTREEFALWLCLQHNIVNKKIGEKQFLCDMKELDRRWKYGGKSCNPE